MYKKPGHKPALIVVTDSSSEGQGSASGITTRSRWLPKDFADKVLSLELEIDRGQFTMDTVNELVR